MLERRLKTKDSVLKPKCAGDFSSKIHGIQNFIFCGVVGESSLVECYIMWIGK
jgi:hypothetical protein